MAITKTKIFVVLAMLNMVFVPITGYGQSVNQTSLQKPRVAIANPIIGRGISEKALSQLNLPILVSEMEASIRATRKFEVLTRQKEVLKIIREEQQFAKFNLSKGNAAKEGEFDNADYLIIPLIQAFSFYRSTNPIPNISGKYRVKDIGLLHINIQIVDTTTGQIKGTFPLKSSLSTEPRVTNTSGGGPEIAHFIKMAKEVSAQFANQLIDTVFPMVILTVRKDQVWINRGSDGGIKNGEMLEVYKPGKELLDPYTHEKLGTAEAYVGKIKVIKVNPKFTIAQIISIENGSIMSGFIVRRAKNEAK